MNHNNDPWHLLRPIKTEILSDNPFELVMYHDILSDLEIEFLQNEGKKRLTRSGILIAGQNTVDRKVMLSNSRQN